MADPLPKKCRRRGLVNSVTAVGTRLLCFAGWLSGCKLQSVRKLQQFSGWLSVTRIHVRKIFNSKSPPKVRACADSRHNFWTTNVKTAVPLWYRLSPDLFSRTFWVRGRPRQTRVSSGHVNKIEWWYVQDR